MNIYYKLPDWEWADSRVVYGKDEDAIAKDGVNYNLWDDESGEDGTKVQWNPDDGGSNDDEASEDGEEGDDSGALDDEQTMCIYSMRSQAELVHPQPTYSMAIKPTVPQITGYKIKDMYGADRFEHQVNGWLQQSIANGSLLSLQPVSTLHQFSVWHKFYLHHDKLHFNPDQHLQHDII
ncbi:hypothetical protein OPQ81_011826 [Rhizoctonia solani]|nr:hypothetical protein OPQ81_011826 [Rhizoctonia solani]